MSFALVGGSASRTSKVSRRRRSRSGETQFATRLVTRGSGRFDYSPNQVEPSSPRSAVTLYLVGAVKPVQARTYMAVDGGMSDNPRPVLYGSGYEAFDVEHPTAQRTQAVRLVGKHCESGDVLIDEAWLPAETTVGSLIATPVTGAYGYSMASNYNRVPRPAVLFVRDGVVREVLRRETFDDMARLEVD